MEESQPEPADAQPWRNTKLSLERPYKDDNAQPIPTLLDITYDGQFVYEPREEWDAKLGQRFRRIFTERGADFFDLDSDSRYQPEAEDGTKGGIDTIANAEETKRAAQEDKDDADADGEAKLMTPEKLFNMRSEILPRLHVALGEMSHARDLLSLLLSTSAPAVSSPLGVSGSAPLLGATSAPISASHTLAPGLLTASTVTAPPPISSVQAFDAQLVTGAKDDVLRKASDVLRTAADEIERSTSRSEQYWADALRIRCANWGLIPAPLPLGAAMGKGSDKTSRDFLISFGLESSPPIFRRNAIAHIEFYAPSSSQDSPLVFPHRDRTRLRVSLTRKIQTGEKTICHSQVRITPGDTLSGAIKGAQKEIVEKEIFSELIKEAGSLPTASARVSERLIVIEAAQDIELRFELIDEDRVASSNTSAGGSSDLIGHALCDLIASSLPVFLLRQHAHGKAVRLKFPQGHVNGTARSSHSPQILQPIIELLQYHVFLKRVRDELLRAVSRLRIAGVTVDLRFEGVGETGQVVLDALLERRETIGGEAILRIASRHAVRFTFTSPSSLTALLPQATIAISSIPQLSQLLADEIERSLLEQICGIGVEVCEELNGTWFLDEMMCRAVGRWEGCVLNFSITSTDNLSLDCHAHRLLRTQISLPAPTVASNVEQQISPTASSTIGMSPATLLTFASRENKSVGLFDWVRRVIDDTLSSG